MNYEIDCPHCMRRMEWGSIALGRVYTVGCAGCKKFFGLRVTSTPPERLVEELGIDGIKSATTITTVSTADGRVRGVDEFADMLDSPGVDIRLSRKE